MRDVQDGGGLFIYLIPADADDRQRVLTSERVLYASFFRKHLL